MKHSIFDLTQQNDHLSAKIVAGLERISEAYRILLWNYAKTSGLSPIQIQILIFIHYHDQDLSKVSHLAKEFNVTKPTISDAVKVLAQKKLIEKIPSSFDKRAYTIQLTNRGKKIIAQTENFAHPIQEITEQLSNTEQRELFYYIYEILFFLNRKGILTIQRMCYSCRFYKKNQNGHFCNLMNTQLQDKDIRIDCAEYKEKPVGNIV